MFPKEVKTDTPDLVKDLMPLKMGLCKTTSLSNIWKGNIYGCLPLVGSCSKGQIGDMDAESYADRVNSMVKLLLTDGNILLGVEETEILVVICTNMDYMLFICEHYVDHILKIQQFGMKVVTVTNKAQEMH